jgi:hypothetical protein
MEEVKIIMTKIKKTSELIRVVAAIGTIYDYKILKVTFLKILIHKFHFRFWNYIFGTMRVYSVCTVYIYPNTSLINDIQGFAYAYKSNKDRIYVHDDWQEHSGYLKIPTVLKYDESNNLVAWGYTALARERPNIKKKKKKEHTKTVKNFILHLCKTEEKPYLPNGLDYKTAIVDYLQEIGKVMKKALKTINFFDNVLIIMTVCLFLFFSFI